MKGFNRSNMSFSLCGLNCGLCPMHLNKYCPGCGGGDGNQSCAIAKCNLLHDNIEYCFQCYEYPCKKYEDIDEYDSFITHQRQLKDIEKAKEIGIEEYNKEQSRKAEILRTLLEEYNDGRRKTFYCVAVNLLPLPDIERAFYFLKESNLSLKDKVENVVSFMQNAAIQQGIVLKLRKKEKRKEE